MVGRKSIRTRGKIQLSKYFQEFEEGASVAVVKETSLTSNFPKRLQGKTGTIIGMRGKTCIVMIKDQNKDKKFLIAPIHLKKIKNSKRVK